jgi:hypothetical protein
MAATAGLVYSGKRQVALRSYHHVSGLRTRVLWLSARGRSVVLQNMGALCITRRGGFPKSLEAVTHPARSR